MISLKKEVLAALIGSEKLISLLGGKKIYAKVPNLEELPAISFFEVTNADSKFADDSSMASEIVIQIDVWHERSTTALAQEVDCIMKSLLFQRTSAADLFEEQTGIMHKAMRYHTVRFEEDEGV